jgi:hypothetical protein
MSFDRYFDIDDQVPNIQKLVAFLVGVCPKGLQRAYQLDLAHPDVEIASGRAPSLGLACQLSAAVVTSEAAKILLGKGRVTPVPHYHQFDACLCRLASGRIKRGNRHLLQRFKRWLLARRLRQLGVS